MTLLGRARSRTAGGATLVAGLMAAACATAQSVPPSQPATWPEGALTLQDARIQESSGLARSGHDADRLWTHNDSFSGARLFAIDRHTGATLATFSLRNTYNLDWEDMAAFDDRGQPALLVADVGDNFAIRGAVSLYVVHEPQRLGDGGALVPLRTLSLRYPDGPRDVEAVAVDPATRQVYLLSKRDPVPRLYRVLLDPPTPLTVQVAEALGPISIPRAPPGARLARRLEWVTAMDFDAAGRRAAVVTAKQVHVYDRSPGEPWIAAFQRMPMSLPLPHFGQIEAAALSADGRALDLSSEGFPAPLARIPLPEAHR